MNKVFLPYVGIGNDDPAWKWLVANMNGKFNMSPEILEDSREKFGNDVIFNEEEDMQEFIIRWAEYL